MDSTQITTHEQIPSRAKTEVIREARRIEEALLYSSKGHHTAAAWWGRFHFIVGIPMVVLSVLSSATALGALADGKTIAAVCALVVTILSSLITFLNPNQRASIHFNAGNKCDALMNRVRIFWSIECWQGESDEVLTSRLKDLSEQKSKLNQMSPQVPTWAYQIAKRGIIAGEGAYVVDQDGSKLLAAGGKSDAAAVMPSSLPTNRAE